MSGASAGAPTGVVSVRRTGGFAGLVSHGRVDLAEDDVRAEELSELVGRIDAAGAAGSSGGDGGDAGDPGHVGGAGARHADRFTYDFDLCGATARVPEQALTSDLRRVAELVLD